MEKDKKEKWYKKKQEKFSKKEDNFSFVYILGFYY